MRPILLPCLRLNLSPLQYGTRPSSRLGMGIWTSTGQAVSPCVMTLPVVGPRGLGLCSCPSLTTQATVSGLRQGIPGASAISLVRGLLPRGEGLPGLSKQAGHQGSSAHCPVEFGLHSKVIEAHTEPEDTRLQQNLTAPRHSAARQPGRQERPGRLHTCAHKHITHQAPRIRPRHPPPTVQAKLGKHNHLPCLQAPQLRENLPHAV